LIDREECTYNKIHDGKKSTRRGPNTKNMHRYNHTLGLGKYPHPLQKWLGESPPKVEETKLWRGLAAGTAGAPVAVKESWRWQ
jgi:hypothetical protein